MPSEPEQEPGPEIAATGEAPAPAEPVAVSSPEPAMAGRLADLERELREAVRDREIAKALLGKPLVPGAAGQLLRLWREEFDVVADGDRLVVVSPEGRGVSESIDAFLDRPDYAHFRAASTRGGTGLPGAGRSATPGSAIRAASPPRTLGESILERWRSSGPDPSGGWGRRRS